MAKFGHDSGWCGGLGTMQANPSKHKTRPRYAATNDAGSRVICPGAVGFETSSARGDRARCWLQIRHDQALMGVSVRVLGMVGLGLGCPQVPCPTRERERGDSLAAGRGGRAVRTSGRECVAPGRGSGVAARTG
jgi:hypothetical protein